MIDDSLPEQNSALAVACQFMGQVIRGRRLVYIILCVCAGGLFTLSTIVAPLLIRRLIALIDTGMGTRTHITHILLILVVIYLLRGIGRYGYGWFSHVVSYEVMHDLITRIYRHVQVLSHRYLNRQQTGSLVARSVSDVETVEDFVAHGIPEISLAILGPLIMMGILFTVDPLLALLAISPLPVASFILYKNAHRIRRFWWEVRAGLAELIAQIQDNLSGLTEIKLFNQEVRQLQQVDERSQRFRDASISAMGISMIPGSAVEITGGLGLILVVGTGGSWALNGRLSLADFFLFISYISFIYLPFMHLAEMGDKLSKAIVSLERIHQLLQVEPEIRSPAQAEDPRVTQQSPIWNVEFEDVHFAYQPESPALCGVSFTIEPGQTVALAGPTGAGKTTISRLIPRLYDVDAGAVRVGQVDVQDWPLDALRDQISCVLQEVFLFHGTIRQNLLLGHPEASDAELEDVIAAARATDFIAEMPYGLDTVIGERGVRLSGGQRQRVSIARALLKDAPILVLDEATSNVDAITELEIHEALQHLMAGRTTLVIAHRLSTIRHADVILFLQEGQIQETGTFDQLVTAGGRFAHMVEAQMLLQAG